MSLVQVTPAGETSRDGEIEEPCFCCMNRVRVVALKRQRHAAWLGRGEKRRPAARD